jgi:hypothetical protein
VVGKLIGLAAADHLFVQPVPARTAQFEIDDKVQGDAPGYGFVESGIEIDVEVCGQRIAVVACGKVRVADADVGSRPACQRNSSSSSPRNRELNRFP